MYTYIVHGADRIGLSYNTMHTGVIVPGGARCYNNILCAAAVLKTCFTTGRDSIVRLKIATTGHLYIYIFDVLARDEKGRHNIKLPRRLRVVYRLTCAGRRD